MSYDIDANAVNTRVDWRQKPVYPGLMGRRQEVFPGDGNLYVVIDKQMPAGVIITGFLEDNNIAGLQNKLDTEAARVADTTLRTIALNGASYANQHLLAFDLVSGIIAFQDGAGKVKIRVRYSWQGVRA